MVQSELNHGTIFDIQGFSVHDGPGCRTLIFFKGCSLRCAWCCNPEGLDPFPEPLYNVSACTFDELCVNACPAQAIGKNSHQLVFNRNLCMDCSTHDCITACCSGALRLGGYNVESEELFGKIQRDRHYWGSEGGVTLTGGEPFLQPDFAARILKRCYDSFIHTAVETCGNVPWENIERSLNWIEWIFYDIKHTDKMKHTRMTSKGNNLILDNARRLAESFKGRIIFRMPIIPGFNDDKASVQGLSDFLISIEKYDLNILPVHHLGKGKYNLVGKGYYTDDLNIPGNDELQRIQSLFKSRGINCCIGSETPF